jgi:cytochrome c6
MKKLLFILLLPGMAMGQEPGKLLYSKHCAACHGDNGARGRFGARDLQRSVLTDTLIVRQITRGKGVMPAFSRRLTAGDILSIMNYIKTLRNS